MKEVVLTRESFKDLTFRLATIGGLGYICTRLLLPEIRCQCFIRIFLTFWLAGLKVLTNGKIFLDDFGLFLIAVLRDENWASANTFLDEVLRVASLYEDKIKIR